MVFMITRGLAAGAAIGPNNSELFGSTIVFAEPRY